MIDFPWIGTGAGNDQFRLMLSRQFRHLIKINSMIGFTHSVRNRLVKLTRKIQIHSVSQMPPHGQIHGEKHIAGLECRLINGHIRLRTGVRLYIRILRSEQAFGPFNREDFHHIHVLAAAIIPSSWVPFCIFVSEHCSGGFQNRSTGVVFGCNQLQAVVLSHSFILDRRPENRISGLQSRHRSHAPRKKVDSICLFGIFTGYPNHVYTHAHAHAHEKTVTRTSPDCSHIANPVVLTKTEHC